MKFIVGKEYVVQCIGDSSIKDQRKVIERTDKMLTLADGSKKKIFNDYDGEFIYPEGRYSKAPVMKAKRVVK